MLRDKLMILTYEENNPEKALETLQATNPRKASMTDLLFLFRLMRPRINNRLAYLQMEARLWVKENIEVVRKRMNQIVKSEKRGALPLK